ncbi:hypothetical protein ACFQZ4_06530 [Catellatospora coxensis]|uniref:Uncharacterized protein n=1 Tax=Catellatospora coxensis TaxID=310354 RepID=A0A8J3PD32_9ACTN|nr:hypothetical protein [Catellatospora coxensis]GIG10631.1 hypothetical protein Cco03nite_73310 [Catellatospora coxensis]
MNNKESRPLLGQRAMLILLLAFLVGLASALLAKLAGNNTAGAMLIAGAATAGAVAFFNTILD